MASVVLRKGARVGQLELKWTTILVKVDRPEPPASSGRSHDGSHLAEETYDNKAVS